MSLDDSVNFHLPLKAGYGDELARKELKSKGYSYDPALSNDNEQVYYNPVKRKLLYNVSGTHNLKDWVTDAYLAVGKLKSTTRFKEAKDVLNKAKEKYKPENTTISGHSLGGGISNYIKNKNDKVITYNAGYSPFAKARKNVTNYTSKGDFVSLFAPNQKTLNNSIINRVNPLSAHSTENLKHELLYI
jgi:hypothetical protein